MKVEELRAWLKGLCATINGKWQIKAISTQCTVEEITIDGAQYEARAGSFEMYVHRSKFN